MKDYLNVWSPVKCEKKSDRFSLDVWGRSYDFDKSPLPTKITTQGQNLLYAPIKLVPVFGEESEEWKDFSALSYYEDEEKAIFITSQTAGNIILNSAVTVEYDGFVKIDLKVMSYWSFVEENIPKLTGLYMDIPVKKEYASLMHYWPNDRQSIIPLNNVMNSGKTVDMEFPFKPYISLGNNEVGLGVFCGESVRNFMLDDEDKCISIADMGEYINIRLRFLDYMPENWQGRRDKWTKTLKPLTYTIGFQATPVKPMRTGDDVYKITTMAKSNAFQETGVIDYDYLEKMKSTGVKWLVLHEAWAVIQNFGMSYNEEILKKYIEECHARDIKVMVYFGYEYSTYHPEWNEKSEEYLIKTVDGEFTGGWQRLPHQRAFMACYNGGYSDVMIERVKYVMDELGVDGIYTDGTYVPWECANTAHGCGYTDKKGELHTTFPILAVREHVKKLYEEVHKRGGIIDTHQSSCCIMPTLSFCDSYFDGENIQPMLKKEDMSFLNMDAFRAEYMGYNFGIPANFLAYSNEMRPISTLYALSLLHNVHCRPAAKDIDYVSFVWKIFDEYKLNDAKWYPYWRNELVKTEGETAYVSCYEGETGLVAVAAYFSKENGEMVVIVPENSKSVKNLITGEVYRVENNKVNVQLEMSTLGILLIE